MSSPTLRTPNLYLARAEARLFLRSGGSVLWTALAPIVALVALGLIPGIKDPARALHGQSYLSAYLPILIIFSICMATMNILPPVLATYRERGVLRRMATTPVPPVRLLAAQALIYFAMALVVAVVLIAIAVGAYGVSMPDQLMGFVLGLLLTGAATTGVGLVIAAVARTGKAANAISAGLFFPLMFLAGLWVPRAQMPHGLRVVSDYSPLGAGVRAVQTSIAGNWPAAGALLVLAGYAVVLLALAARLFRWE